MHPTDLPDLCDYHTHNQLCQHARGDLTSYVQAAIHTGLGGIGLSDHFPMCFLPEDAHVWQFSMRLDEFPRYLDTGLRLQQQFGDRIFVKIGSEVDFFEPSFAQYRAALDSFRDRMDYLIGSVHVIQLPHYPPFGVDDPIGTQMCQQLGEDAVFSAYYTAVERMVRTRYYSIVGHLDLPKKFGIFRGTTSHLWQRQLDLLDLIAQTEMTVEINHSGILRPIHEPYPADHLLPEIITRGIPLCLSSDAHSPDQVGQFFEQTLPKLRRLSRELHAPVRLSSFSHFRNEPRDLQ